MGSTKVGQYLWWDAADTTGIVGAMRIIAIFWEETPDKRLETDQYLSITDENDVEIFHKEAQADGDGVEIVIGFPGMPVDGIKIATMTGGELFIWVDRYIPTNRTG